MNFLHDGTGNLSSTRLIVLVWGFIVLGVWSYLSIKSGTIVEIPIGVAGTFGAVLALKGVQSFSPNDQATDTK